MYSSSTLTSDQLIRTALKESLRNIHKDDHQAKIIEELGVTHGAARVDIAVINGSIHGYELKSDIDTLYRLPSQMRYYNSVFDRITLVVGKSHLHEAIKIVPEWWGITIAKIIPSGEVLFCNIREAEQNPYQTNFAVATLLWRNEALNILEESGRAKGVRSKARKVIYERLAEALDKRTLKSKVTEYLCARANWRSEILCTPDGD
ncbi:sce7726 family protein [Candidatus Manganitrophus noduliformans]|uniref:Sce7726 family protein n=1 Tax=Candidatus Manganitrophus noduliformans TaxID=2606439 RepID=A0A7X6ICR7_9BACT|nr:sce7726 family protein [Candidatus Manganitrophus noduliformans]NKE72983.1 sce7726 family protein [Candidatus Manganitrophus noduliformans]